jgi:hypothetical protein
MLMRAGYLNHAVRLKMREAIHPTNTGAVAGPPRPDLTLNETSGNTLRWIWDPPKTVLQRWLRRPDSLRGIVQRFQEACR